MAVDKNGKPLPKGITLRSDGRYQARYAFQGKRRYLYDADLKNLQKRLRAAVYEVEHGIHANPDKITVKIWFDIWMEEYKKHSVKQLTISAYNNTFDRYIEKPLGKKKLNDVRPEHIQKLYNDMAKEEYSNATIELVGVVIGGMFKQAVKNGLLIKNPVGATTMPKKKEKKVIKVLSGDEQDKVLGYVKGTDKEALFVLCFSTGIRVGELAALTWNDIDFKNGNLSINKTLSYRGKDNYVLNGPKTLSGIREIPIFPNVVKLLKKHKVEQARQRLALGDKWQPVIENLVFTNDFGEPLRRRRVDSMITTVVNSINKDEAREAAEEKREPVFMKDFTPHTMRHSFATRALENGMPPKVVQEILGHSNIAMTLDLYTHVLPKTKKEEMKKMEYLFS